MPWIGRFSKDKDRPTESNVGVGYADWYDNDVLICTYSQRVEGISDKTEFKANAIEYREKYVADKTKEDTLSSSLTTFLNQ